MKKFILILFPISALAQTGSEILLMDLKLSKNGMEISNPKNVTNHSGYDNQPFFHIDEPILYYSSFNEDGRSDIRSYNYKTGKTTNITTTQEREYSPTLTPDKNYLSCIIQRDNNAQDLGKYPLDGGEPVVLIDDLIVGYHAWLNESNLLLFVLGNPQTLQAYHVPSKTGTIVATKIGRSLHAIPNSSSISFVDKSDESSWIIRKYSNKDEISEIAETLSGREDLAWTPDGRIVMSDGEKLFWYNKENTKWIPVKMDTPLKGATRLAISSDGKKLAVVVSE